MSPKSFHRHTSFFTSELILRNHLHVQCDIYSYWFATLIESLLGDTNTNRRKRSINTTRSKWYSSNGWPHSASSGDQISCGLFALLPKITLRKGCRELFTPDLHGWGREIYLPLSGCCHFWEGMYSAFQRSANNGMVFVNGQCCG